MGFYQNRSKPPVCDEVLCKRKVWWGFSLRTHLFATQEPGWTRPPTGVVFNAEATSQLADHANHNAIHRNYSISSTLPSKSWFCVDKTVVPSMSTLSDPFPSSIFTKLSFIFHQTPDMIPNMLTALKAFFLICAMLAMAQQPVDGTASLPACQVFA